MTDARPAADVTVESVNTFLATEFAGTASQAHELGDGWAVARLDADATTLRPGGIISGPTVFALADAALWFALFTVCGFEPMALTSELSIRYLRPARGTELFARATIDHAGRRSVIGSITCWTDDPDAPVAVAQGTYVRPRSTETDRPPEAERAGPPERATQH